MTPLEMIAVIEGLVALTIKLPQLIPAVQTIVDDVQEFLNGSDDTTEELIGRIQAARKKVEAVD
jgi:hypothetical protein